MKSSGPINQQDSKHGQRSHEVCYEIQTNEKDGRPIGGARAPGDSELEVDLIILSTHGRSGVARVLLGSTAEKVVRHAGCPVLVVRENEHKFLAQEPKSGNDRKVEAII